MKKKLILLLFLLTLFGVIILGRYLFLSKENSFGLLKITSVPSSTVFINSVAIGKTPLTDYKYKTGEIILKLIPEKTATETASWQGKVQIYKNALTVVNRELGSSDINSSGNIFTLTKMPDQPQNPGTGEVYIETEPQGAIVYLDNDEKGVGSLLLQNILKGDHELSVFMPQFIRRTQKINVEPGFRVNAAFKLAIDQSQKTTTPTGVDTSETASDSASKNKTMIVVNDTPTGWLRVRAEPSVNASESARVNPGEKYEVMEEKEGWYKIQYIEGKMGWISSEYTKKQ